MKNGNKEWQPLTHPRLADPPVADSTLLNYQVRWAAFPMAFFGVAIDKAKMGDKREARSRV